MLVSKVLRYYLLLHEIGCCVSAHLYYVTLFLKYSYNYICVKLNLLVMYLFSCLKSDLHVFLLVGNSLDFNKYLEYFFNYRSLRTVFGSSFSFISNAKLLHISSCWEGSVHWRRGGEERTKKKMSINKYNKYNRCYFMRVSPPPPPFCRTDYLV